MATPLLLRQVVDLQQRAWSVALRAALLPVGSLLRRSDRHLTWRLWEAACGAQRPGVYPEIPLGSLLSADRSVTLQSIPNQTYNVSEVELLAISALVRQVDARIVFEFGTADGRTTVNIAANAAPGGTVFTLNLPLSADDGSGQTGSWQDSAGHVQNVPVGFHFRNRQTPASIVQLWGNSQAYDYAPYLGRCQVVFVDADHFDPGVSIDIRTALTLVDREDGIVIWHDALRYDVQTALPRIARTSNLPVHLVAGTNLAVLCFSRGDVVSPDAWTRGHAR